MEPSVLLINFEAVFQSIATKGVYLIVVIVIDLAVGVAAAIRTRTFEWSRLADFLRDYTPKVIGWLALEFLTVLPKDILLAAQILEGVATVAYMAIMLSGLGSILKSLKDFGILTNIFPSTAPASRTLTVTEKPEE